MSIRISRAVLLLLLSAIAANAAGQSCDAPTKHVYIIFDGCAGLEPDLAFDVYVGNERITVRKTKKEDLYWKGTTAETFAIGRRPLRIPDEAAPFALVTCDTPAKGLRDGACVALYRVKCEPLWLIDVQLVPKSEPPYLTYERRAAPQTVNACDRLELPVGPGEVDFADTESLLVKLDQPKCQIPLSKRAFRRKSELTLADVPVNAVNPRGVVAETGATDEFARRALMRKVKEMRFTKKN